MPGFDGALVLRFCSKKVDMVTDKIVMLSHGEHRIKPDMQEKLQ